MSVQLDYHAITSQKIAVGYVEKPACNRLRELAALVPANQAIVEIGAFRGRSTGYLAAGALEGNRAHVYSVDTWDTRPLDTWPADRPGYVANYPTSETRAAYEAHLDRTGIRPLVTPICGWSTEVAASWKREGRPEVGLLFHDAAHHHAEVLTDLRAWLPLMAAGSVVTLHDAGNDRYGVYTAAAEAFKRRTRWDWAGHELQRWYRPDANGIMRDTNRRGLLIVRSKA